mmetsp:Transcript_60401/g.148606  ORF Transcript_60401/g.148606 Transcript_60401/m.148606 type:complete len:211 (-) Transcript_60401:83-715(-)
MLILLHPRQLLRPAERRRQLVHTLHAVLPDRGPTLLLGPEQPLERGVDPELELGHMEEQEQQLLGVESRGHEVAKLAVLALAVQHQPPKIKVAHPEAVEEIRGVVEHVVLRQCALRQQLRQLSQPLVHVGRVRRVYLSDELGLERVVERRHRSLVWLPHDTQIDHKAHIEGQDPVVGHVFIDDLAHRRALAVQCVGEEEEDNVHHRGLSG